MTLFIYEWVVTIQKIHHICVCIYIYIYIYIYIQGEFKVALPRFLSICIKTMNARNMVLVPTY